MVSASASFIHFDVFDWSGPSEVHHMVIYGVPLEDEIPRMVSLQESLELLYQDQDGRSNAHVVGVFFHDGAMMIFMVAGAAIGTSIYDCPRCPRKHRL